MLASNLSNFTRWALNCPQPKHTLAGYFFHLSSHKEPVTVTTAISTLSIDVFAVMVTCLAAYFLQWIINYFVRFCASCGYVLSGADGRESTSAPPSPPRRLEASSSVATAVESANPSQSTVKMNEPVDCSMSRSGITGSHMSLGSHVTYRHNTSSKSSSSSQNSRLESGLDPVLEGPPCDEQDIVITVYAAANKPTGSFSLAEHGLIEFIWLDSSSDKVSITGSFLGHTMSLPLTREEDVFRMTIKLSPGSWDYEFLAEHHFPDDEVY